MSTGPSSPQARAPHDRPLKALPFPSAFAFIGSGCLLVLELVAGRILAPDVGVSLYTWTSVIGVVLAGLSLGNWLGGKIADWRPGRSTLSLLYLLSAVTSALILLFADNLDSVDAPHDWTTILQVLWLATLVFFLPSVVLGTPVPMIVKLALHSLDATGRVVGRIQAAASVGSIVGVFLTGFVLISAFGTKAIVAGVAVTLGLLALLSNPIVPDPRQLRVAVSRPAGAALLGLMVLAATLGVVLR
jgi:predicted MFS family arabinose efflux permease